jgi:hypothetical protein
MNKSRIFHAEAYRKVEKDIVRFVNSQKDFMSKATISSTRAAGDAIQGIIADNFDDILGHLCGAYSAEFARRAMADIAFTDKDGFYNVVDVKTHRLDTHFNMPNLTSVERLTRFYEDDNNYFVVLTVAYAVKGTRVKVERVHFVPIEFLSWECLTIGALGWGQIQISNSNKIVVDAKCSRKKWMLEFCDVMLEFYPKELQKIDKRIKHFQRVKKTWEQKSE